MPGGHVDEELVGGADEHRRGDAGGRRETGGQERADHLAAAELGLDEADADDRQDDRERQADAHEAAGEDRLDVQAERGHAQERRPGAADEDEGADDGRHDDRRHDLPERAG